MDTENSGKGVETAERTEGAAPSEERALAEALARLQAEAQEKDKALAALTERARLAAAKYRQVALTAAPEVPEEMVQGETVEEIDAALARARKLVEEVRKRTAARAAESPRTPAGAPVRSAPDLSGLTAREKIAYGLARRE